jgi:preprotein translocase subunit SecG
MLNSYETVFSSVPGSSLFWTKRGFTAAMTRSSLQLILLFIAVIFMYDTGTKLSNIVVGSRHIELSCPDAALIHKICHHL